VPPMTACGHAFPTNDSMQRRREAVKRLRIYVAAFTCHTVTGPLHHRLAQYMVAIFSASRDHRIAVFHRLRFPTFRHSDITTSRPSHCCVVTVSITTSLHAQRMSATFAACQHPRIPIFHRLRIPTFRHHYITAWEGPAILLTQQMFHRLPGGMRGTHPITHTAITLSGACAVGTRSLFYHFYAVDL
jgi:hypothetical protein